jgi:formylmethanofuran dehydrogenase subunit E
MKTKEQISEYRKQYRLNNQEKIKAYRQKNRPRQKELDRKLNRAKRLRERGMSEEDFNSKLNQQEGKCAICDKPQDESIKFLSIDHDHKTNKNRGLLCSNCNRGIGLLQDDINILQSAIKYLKQYQNLLHDHGSVF